MDHSTLDSLETRRLLDLVQEGDRQALDPLLARHRRYLVQLVGRRLDRKLAARVDASDVVQEALAEVARRVPDYLLKHHYRCSTGKYLYG